MHASIPEFRRLLRAALAEVDRKYGLTERIIAGAIRDNVNAHGAAVEHSWIGSAAKRVTSQLIGAGLAAPHDSDAVAYARRVIREAGCDVTQSLDAVQDEVLRMRMHQLAKALLAVVGE